MKILKSVGIGFLGLLATLGLAISLAALAKSGDIGTLIVIGFYAIALLAMFSWIAYVFIADKPSTAK